MWLRTALQKEPRVPIADNRVIVSDLHLATGRDPRTDRPGSDAALARFVSDLRRRAALEGRKWRLVILGDLFDFLRSAGGEPRPGSLPPDTSEKATLAKLERIAADHPALLEALGQFLAAGFALDIVPGNHDIELLRPSAQERCKELLAGSNPHAEAAAAITFYPWMYYVPGVLYAEHGHQYHDINAFHTLLQPYTPGLPDQVDLPLASYLEVYLRIVRDAIDLPAHGRRRPAPGVPVALRSGPLSLVLTWPQHVHFLRLALSHPSCRSSAALAARRADYRSRILVPYSLAVGLGPETVIAIDRLSATSAGAMMRRLLRSLLARVGPALPASDYLYRACLEIHRLLRAAGKAVPYYVFGHSHRPAQYPLPPAGAASSYLNCGAWAASAPGSPQAFPFVEISCDRPAGAPAARLRYWHDAGG